MADSVDQILDNIPIVIQTGIPENIKSYNHRPLMIEIAKHLVRGRENAENGKYYIIRGVNDPDNPGEVMFVMTQMSTQRQISMFDEYDDLPGSLLTTLADQFFYVRKTQTIYTREGSNLYQPLGYLKKIKVIEALPGTLINLPEDEGTGVYVIEIKDSLGNIKSDAGVWLGGYSGIYVGHDSIVFAKEATPGGLYSDVGHQFVVINQRRQTVIEYYDHLTDFPNPGRPNVIYVEEDTMITYYWSPSIVNYVANGSAIYGELIDSTTFEDELGNIVTPGSANIYIDITDDNKAYNWDGGQYVPINSTSSGGGGTSFIGLTDTPSDYTGQAGKIVKVNDAEDGLEFTENKSTSDITLEEARQNGNVLDGDVEFNDGSARFSFEDIEQLFISAEEGVQFADGTKMTQGSLEITGCFETSPLGIIGDSEFDKQGDRKAFAQIGDVEDAINDLVIPSQINLIEGTNIEITGTYPNITISAIVEPIEWSQTDW